MEGKTDYASDSFHTRLPEVWVGYSDKDRHYLDKIELQGTTGMTVRALREWWEIVIPRRTRVIQRAVFCQRPMVGIGRLPIISHEIVMKRALPVEIQFRSIERSEFLSRAFHSSCSLISETAHFNEHAIFTSHDSVVTERQVLYIGWELDKRILAYPLFGSLFLSALISVVVGLEVKSTSTGAQVGSALTGFVAVILGYLAWICN